MTSPELAAAEAAQLAEAEAVETIRRQTQLPTVPGLSLFKAAPVAVPAPFLPPVLLPQAPPLPMGQQGITLSTSSDASAYSQPAAAVQPAGGATASSLPTAYGVPVPSALSSGIDAGLAALVPMPGLPLPVTALGAWPATPQHLAGAPQLQWAAPLPPRYGEPALGALPLPGVPLQP